jgi:hypothetical protein
MIQTKAEHKRTSKSQKSLVTAELKARRCINQSPNSSNLPPSYLPKEYPYLTGKAFLKAQSIYPKKPYNLRFKMFDERYVVGPDLVTAKSLVPNPTYSSSTRISTREYRYRQGIFQGPISPSQKSYNLRQKMFDGRYVVGPDPVIANSAWKWIAAPRSMRLILRF